MQQCTEALKVQFTHWPNCGGRKREWFNCFLLKVRGPKFVKLGLVVPSHGAHTHAQHTLKASLVFCYAWIHRYAVIKWHVGLCMLCASCTQPRIFTHTSLAYCKSEGDSRGKDDNCPFCTVLLPFEAANVRADRKNAPPRRMLQCYMGHGIAGISFRV